MYKVEKHSPSTLFQRLEMGLDKIEILDKN